VSVKIHFTQLIALTQSLHLLIVCCGTAMNSTTMPLNHYPTKTNNVFYTEAKFAGEKYDFS